LREHGERCRQQRLLSAQRRVLQRAMLPGRVR
jgi:hypothetical protein